MCYKIWHRESMSKIISPASVISVSSFSSEGPFYTLMNTEMSGLLPGVTFPDTSIHPKLVEFSCSFRSSSDSFCNSTVYTVGVRQSDGIKKKGREKDNDLGSEVETGIELKGSNSSLCFSVAVSAAFSVLRFSCFGPFLDTHLVFTYNL